MINFITNGQKIKNGMTYIDICIKFKAYICDAYICQVIKKAGSQVHFLSSMKRFVDNTKWNQDSPSILKVISHVANSVDNEANDYTVNA